MNFPSARFVFDRKHQATNKKEGLVQIEILYKRQRKWIGTGVKVLANQWSDTMHVINRMDAVSLNMTLDAQLESIRSAIREIIEQNKEFSFDMLKMTQNNELPGSFIEFCRIYVRDANLSEGTKRHYSTLVTCLEEYKKIDKFSDVTEDAIIELDKHLHTLTYGEEEKKISDSGVWNYHKCLRPIIKEACRQKLITINPYNNLKFNKGKSKAREYLTEEELSRLRTCVIDNKCIDHVRDLFLFQCFTGLSYVEISTIDFANRVVSRSNKRILTGRRVKTNSDYYISLMPQAIEILEKYNYDLRVISLDKYNKYISTMAGYADISKHITSHIARHTFAVFALNNGVAIETVSKILGHTNIQTTQIYARIINKTIEDEFDKLAKVLG